MQRAARPTRPLRAGSASYSLLLEAQEGLKCLATGAPSDPTGLVATASGQNTINLVWDADATPAPDEATYWGIEWSANGSTGWTPIGANAPTNSFSDTGLAPSTTRYYRVTAYNCFGASALTSNVANATTASATVPADPTGVSASPSTDGSAVAVTITWTDASSDETGFYVYRNTTNTTVGATLLSTLGAGVQTYTDNAANSGANAPAINTTYYYFVSAYNGIGESTKVAASQNSTGGVTTLNVPAAPTSLTATATSTTQIDLAWTDNATNETGYTVERRSPAGSGSYSTVTTLSAGANSFSNTGLTESVQYEYRVYATNAAGNSANSNAASKYTIPATPTGLTATAISSSQIDLAWTDVSTGNTGQRIERRTPSGSGSYSTLTTVSATATTYSDTGLTASTSYEYRIVATNPDYDSSPSTAANATTQSGALTPSWSIDWSSGTPSGYTLTRASSGTYVDSSGYIASASTDVARLTHDSSGNRLGLLVEESRVNFSGSTESLATNVVVAVGATRTENDATGPDNTTSADRLELTSTGYIYKRTATTVNAGSYVASVWVKAKSTAETVRFRIAGGSTNPSGLIQTSTITTSTTDWTRVVLPVSTWTGSAQSMDFGIDQRSAVGSGPGTSCDVLLWGWQIEEVPSATAGTTVAATSYVPNTSTTASVTRSADLAHVLDTNITSWGDPGALVIHFYPPGQAGTLLSTDDASTAQVGIEASSTTAARAFWSSGSTSTGTIGSSGVQKAVHYWNGSASKFCINGGTVQSGTNNFTIANADFVTLGAEATDSSGVPGTFSQYANCVIRYVAFYSGTLTDANLQTITT